MKSFLFWLMMAIGHLMFAGFVAVLYSLAKGPEVDIVPFITIPAYIIFACVLLTCSKFKKKPIPIRDEP